MYERGRNIIIIETLFSVLALSVLSGMLLRLFPKTSRLVPYVRFLSALVLLVMLLSPLISLLSSLHLSDSAMMLLGWDGLEAYESFWAQSVTDAASARVKDALGALICAEYGMATEDIRVDLTTEMTQGEDETTVTVTSVTVLLGRREHRIAAGKIEELIEETMLCPCTVVFMEEEHA